MPIHLYKTLDPMKKVLIGILALLCIAVTSVSSVIAYHANQGDLSHSTQALATARTNARAALAAAQGAGLPTTELQAGLAMPAPTTTDRFKLLVAGTENTNPWIAQINTLDADSAALAPQITAWKKGMGAITGLRSTLTGTLSTLLSDMPQEASIVASKKASLPLLGPVATPDQAAAVTNLTATISWARSLITAEATLKTDIATTSALVTQAHTLKVGTATLPQLLSQLQGAAATDTTVTGLGNADYDFQNDSDYQLVDALVLSTNPGPGKVIVIHLAAQSLTAYDNGKVVLKTPVTTGRPGLTTPVGVDSIGYHETPYLFISPWPAGSADYYDPTWVTWVMEFHAGGYYIHDAWWEPNGVYGPGSEYGGDASHGCVQTPHAAMAFLYSWTPNGTTVVVAP